MRRILFLQVTDPAAYPPLINAAHLFSEAGWQTMFLSYPTSGQTLRMPDIPNMRIVSLKPRASNRISRLQFADYCWQSICQARSFKPDFLYVSDILATLPGWLAQKFTGARLIYHEHDSSTNGLGNHAIIDRARSAVVSNAHRVVFPNRQRAVTTLDRVAFDHKRLSIIWNLPRTSEIPETEPTQDDPFIVYYHGTITRERLPESIVRAISAFNGRVILQVLGYETVSSNGYLAYLTSTFGARDRGGIIEFLGQRSRSSLLEVAAQAHIGLALMPMASDSLDMRHMVGASNKAFDYMAAGLPVIVSDLPDWRHIFVDKKFGFALNPESESEFVDLLHVLLRSRDLLNEMSSRCQEQIKSSWNYDAAFEHLIADAEAVMDG